MYYDDDEDEFPNLDLYDIISREIYQSGSRLDVTPFGLRSVPTHTEDGIPIRKLYVSNISPKATRNELFGVFAQYGFIKSCWLKMGEKGPFRTPAPTYAFVTYSNPADAHKALQAPSHELMLHDRFLRTSPADSWHQPNEDSENKRRWKPRRRYQQYPESPSPTSSNDNDEDWADCSASHSGTVKKPEKPEEYTILDILNRDCLMHILSYVPIRDLIRSEGVSRGWRHMINDHLQTIRTFKTSWWQHSPVTLTTAVLRRLLQRVGVSLTTLHIDQHWSALNDRTAHTIGKFCPNLEELKVVSMLTKNWNPLLYGCTQLKNLAFISCNKLTDASLVHLVKSESDIESLTVANNTHVTGLFLTRSRPLKLHSLAFYNCYSLQGTVLSAAVEILPRLTCLRLDVCPVSMWKIIPTILSKLPKLQELSLCDYTSLEVFHTTSADQEFCKAFTVLTELRTLNLSRNISINDAILKQIAQSCQKLERLNVSSCNARRSSPNSGVGDEGISAVFRGCSGLVHVDVSYLAALTDAGVEGAAGPAGAEGAANKSCSRLERLTARGNSALTTAPFMRCLATCHQLKEIDVCGCDGVSEELIATAVQVLQQRPRHLLLRLGGTPAASAQDYPSHKMLTVNLVEDLSNPHLRPDFVDRIFDHSSDDSMDDLYDHEDFDEFLGADDDLFLDEDDIENYEDLLGFGIHHDIILI